MPNETLHAETPPPPYSRHQLDERYTENATQAIQPASRISMLDAPPSWHEAVISPRPLRPLDLEPAPRVPASRNTISTTTSATPPNPSSSENRKSCILTLNNHTISLTSNSSIHPLPTYHLPRTPTWPGNEISLQTSTPSSPISLTFPPAAIPSNRQPTTHALTLYTLRRLPFTPSITIIPQHRRKAYAGSRTLVVKRLSGVSGRVWEVSTEGVNGGVVLRGGKGRWWDVQDAASVENAKGGRRGREKGSEGRRLVASERYRKGGGQGVLEQLEVEEGVEESLRDLLGAVWIAKIWLENTKATEPKVSGIGGLWGGNLNFKD